jgi:hypothetical protein
MTQTLNLNERTTQHLAPYSVLTVAASANGAASVVRLGDQPGQVDQGTTAVAAGETKAFGPFAALARYAITCTAGTATVEIAPADFPSVVPDSIERIVTISQTDYDALSPPDSATLYLITS